jgi:hypothetical protein
MLARDGGTFSPMGPIWRRIAVICGLTAVAVAGPLLDLYGRNPEVFVANRTRPWEMVLFGLVVVLFIPLLCLAILGILSVFGERAVDIGYLIMAVLLGGATGLVVARQVAPDNVLATTGIALGVAALIAVLHRWARGFLVLAGVALPVVLVMFLATAPASALIWAPDVEPGSGEVGSPAPIVLIQLDEMPAASIMKTDGSVNDRLFPNFARLAAEGTWYRNALSSSIATTQSIPAILTGRLGEKGMSPSSVAHPDNLFSLLAADYEMLVIEWVADMCPEETCPDYAGRSPARFTSLLADVGVVYLHLSLPAQARQGLPSIDNSWKGFLGQGSDSGGIRVDIEGMPVPDEETRVQWADWVQRIANGVPAREGDPVLSYAHLQAPHVPWVTNPSGTHYQRPEDYSEVEGVEGDGRWTTDPGPPLIAFQRHLYQVGMLDAMLGRLFDRLDETGTWDETMVIVLADHGASFVPGQHRRWPYQDNRDDLYRVPMFVKYPGQTEGEVVDEPAYGIDVVPTIVDVMDVETDLEFDGLSLLEIAGTDRPHQPVWWCCSREGANTDLGVLDDQVARNHRWVPDQESWLGVAGAGPHADLIGTELDGLNTVADGDFLWSLDLGNDLLGSRRPRGVVQTYINGRIALPNGVEPDALLVGVNGRVGGMGTLTRDGVDSATFQALIAEELLNDGPNQLELLIYDGAGNWLTGVDHSLIVELRTEDGRLLEIKAEGSRRLQVERAELVGDAWQIRGWAADVGRKQTPDTIYVFADGQLVASGPPNVDNDNVVRWFSSENLLRSGFEFDVPAESIPEAVGQVMVVAEFGDYAIGDATRLKS